MSLLQCPSAANHYQVDHINLLRQSFQRYVGQDMVHHAFPLADGAKWAKDGAENGADGAIAAAIFAAPFVVLSHDATADPVFTYANQTAMALFEMTWDEITALPSRLSAEPPNRDERSRLLHKVTTQGYCTDYSGVRISKTGRRFMIKDVTVWNLVDSTGVYHGQAAAYNQWTYL
ncbi:MAG: MEKHLA domain-containing protein [Leptolyngbyaceae bacterium]|nr:MEKHLA domain-containing protein [Leptolyngbyaceae bacterium]